MRHKGIKVIVLADLYRNQGKHVAHLLVRTHIQSRHLHFAGANTYSIQTIPHQAHAHLSQTVQPENSLEQRNLQPWTRTWERRCLIISIQSTWTDVCIILKLSPSSKLCSFAVPPLPVCTSHIPEGLVSHCFSGYNFHVSWLQPLNLLQGKIKVPSLSISLFLGKQ